MTITGSGNSSALSCGVLNLSNNRATAAVGDALGGISFGHFNNSGSNMGAMIASQLEGSGGANGFGANLGFWTKNDNALTHTEKMRITSTGSVGIGTSIPAAKIDWANVRTFDLSGAGQTGMVIHDTATTQESALVTNGAGFYFDVAGHAAATNNNFVFRTGDTNSGYTVTEKVRISSTGNVGIGVSSPGRKLHILAPNSLPTDGYSGGGAMRISGTHNGVLDFGTDGTAPFGQWLQAYDVRSGVTVQYPILLNPIGGNVGIGTTAPTSQFHVAKTSANSSQLVVGDNPSSTTATTNGFSILTYNSGSNFIDSKAITGGYTYFRTGQGTEAGSTRVWMAVQGSTGNVGIGTTAPAYHLHVIGPAGLSTGTAWANASDARLKDIHGDYEYGLKEILKLHTVRFNYKKNNALGLPSDYPMTGFIAQEVRKVIPDAVHEGKNGYLDLNADPIHWAVVNAVKELGHENAELKRENAAIKTYLAPKILPPDFVIKDRMRS